jgi:hypothetical protein
MRQQKSPLNPGVSTGAALQALAFGCGMDQPVMEQVALCGGHTHPMVSRRGATARFPQVAGRPPHRAAKQALTRPRETVMVNLWLTSIAFL